VSDLLDRLRAWTWRSQGLDREAESPRQALATAICAYSSHPSGPLTLLARGRFDAAAFAALERDRHAIRLPGPRGSIFLLPVETAARIRAASDVPLAKLLPRLQWAGLDLAAYEALKPRVLDALAEPRSAADLERAVPVPGVKVDVVARVMAHEGLVLRIAESLRADRLRYVATAAWLGHPLEPAEPEPARAWLAAEYLRAFGPASVEDFAWWAGLTRSAARAAMAAVETVAIGDGLLLPAALEREWQAAPSAAPEALALVPKWDAYTMGLGPRGRRRLIADDHLALAYSKGGTGGAGATSGDGLPLVLRGGRAIANWSHTFSGAHMNVTVRPWERATVDLAELQPRLDEIAAFLGATSVSVAIAS